MLGTKISYETALSKSAKYKVSNVRGVNAAKFDNKEVITATVLFFEEKKARETDNQLSLYAVCLSEKGQIQFKVQDAANQLASMPEGTSVNLVKDSLPATMPDGTTREIHYFTFESVNAAVKAGKTKVA